MLHFDSHAVIRDRVGHQYFVPQYWYIEISWYITVLEGINLETYPNKHHFLFTTCVEWYDYCCNDSNNPFTHSSFWPSLQLKIIFAVSQNVDTSGVTYRYNTIAALICVCIEWHCVYRKSTLLKSFLYKEWIEKCWPRQQLLSSFESSLMNSLLLWW